MTDLSILTKILNDYKTSVTTPVTPDTSKGIVEPIVSSSASQGNGYGPSYLVDISQAAQNILNGQKNQGTSSQNGINLSDDQKRTIQAILEKYKDAPVNDQTLLALDTDLHNAGVAPDQLASIQENKNFDPIALFLQILNGNDGNSSSNNSPFDLAGITNPSNNSDSSSSSSQLSDLLQQYLASIQPPQSSS